MGPAILAQAGPISEVSHETFEKLVASAVGPCIPHNLWAWGCARWHRCAGTTTWPTRFGNPSWTRRTRRGTRRTTWNSSGHFLRVLSQQPSPKHDYTMVLHWLPRKLPMWGWFSAWLGGSCTHWQVGIGILGQKLPLLQTQPHLPEHKRMQPRTQVQTGN